MQQPMTRSSARDQASWSFLSNHTHVLLCLAQDADSRMRDIAERVGITERAVCRIVTELEDGGVIVRSRSGRRNHYEIDLEATMRHPLESDCTVGSLLSSLLEPAYARRLGLKVRRQRAR